MTNKKFVPRYISSEAAAQGYNNEGRGKLLGYVSNPLEHETSCAYRKNPKRTKVPGEPNAHTGASCNCRIGLWQLAPKPKAVAKPELAKRKAVGKR